MNKGGYKQTELGYLPLDWNVQKLGEISNNVTIGLVKTMTAHYCEQGVPLIRNSNIKEDKIDKENMVFLTYEFAEANENKRLKVGDIVTVHTGDIGTSAVIEKDMDGAHGFATLNTTVNPEIIYNYYLSKYFNSNMYKKQAMSFSTGDGRFNLNLKDFVNSLIPIPPVKEQQKIAEILSSVDAAIEKTEQVIAKTEEVKKGLMQQLLTKGIGHTEFKQTEIGEIPVEWEVKKLVNFSNINSENLTSSTQPEYEFNYIDIAAITDTGIIGETTKYSFCDAPSRARRVVRNKDIIVSTVRPYLKSFAFITEEQEGYIASTGFAIIRVNEDIDSNYIYQHILSERFIEYCKSKMTGSNYPAISANDVKEYSIGRAPLKEQKKISSILNEYDKKLQCEKDKVIKLKSIKQGLMQQLLTGQVRVKVD